MSQGLLVAAIISKNGKQEFVRTLCCSRKGSKKSAVHPTHSEKVAAFGISSTL
jgi:hypothetical protein